ncbi:TPA: hypothetical protein ACHOZL_003844 [Raoultella ornithinolytica]
MATIKDIISSLNEVASPIKEAIEFRARNVFFSSFIISWSCLNWEIISYFLLSSDDILVKIKNINSDTFLPLHNNWLEAISNNRTLAPFLISVAITISYPIFTLIIAFVHKKVVSAIDKITNERTDLIESNREKHRAKTEMETQAYKEQTIKSKRNIESILQITAEHEVQVQTLEQNKVSLNAFITELTKRKDELTSEIQSMNEELTPLRSVNEILKISTNENNTLKYKVEELNSEIVNIKNDIKNNLEIIRMRDGDIRLLNEHREQLTSIIQQVRDEIISIRRKVNDADNLKAVEKSELIEPLDILSSILDSSSLPKYHPFEGI